MWSGHWPTLKGPNRHEAQHFVFPLGIPWTAGFVGEVDYASNNFHVDSRIDAKNLRSGFTLQETSWQTIHEILGTASPSLRSEQKLILCV